MIGTVYRQENECIPEERESNPSPNHDPSEVECGRESLAERPGLEGSVRSPVMMQLSSPFAVQSRQIPNSNCKVRGMNGATAIADRNGELVTHLRNLQIGNQLTN